MELLGATLVDRLSHAPVGFRFSAPTKKFDEWNIACVGKDGTAQLRLVENKEIMPHQGECLTRTAPFACAGVSDATFAGIVLLADWALGIAIYTGKDTKFSVNDGE